VFGPVDDRRGLVLEGVKPRVVPAKDVPEGQLWVHDIRDVGAALVLANMPAADFPIPIGVFVDVEAPVYEDILLAQEQRALSDRGPGDIKKLLTSGDTWKIG
jgi:2-oxoglutarate/2-oxoacid ferredoxin oxidoreductase subunit beta